jgi:hypothetical protein
MFINSHVLESNLRREQNTFPCVHRQGSEYPKDVATAECLVRFREEEHGKSALKTVQEIENSR